MTQAQKAELENEMLLEYFIAEDVLKLELTQLGKEEIKDIDLCDLRNWVLDECHLLVCVNELGCNFVIDELGNLFELDNNDLKELFDNSFTELNVFNNIKHYLDSNDDSHVKFYKWYHEIGTSFQKTSVEDFNNIYDTTIQPYWSTDAIDEHLMTSIKTHIINTSVDAVIKECIKYKIDLMTTDFHQLKGKGIYIAIVHND